MIGPKVLGKCLSRLETSTIYPPFLQLYFFKRLILEEELLLIEQNARKKHFAETGLFI